MTTIAEMSERDRTDEQTRRLAAAVRDANDAVIVQAFDGRIVAWNHGAERLYGWSGSEALAMNFRDIVPEPERQEARKLVERLVRGEPVSSLEMQRVTRDGRILDVWLTVTVLRDADGQPSGIATIERDITARKRAQATLRQREMNLRAFLESAPDGMVVADEGGSIQFVNAQVERLFGYSRDELLGMAVEQLMPGRFRGVHIEHRNQYLRRPRARGMGAGLALFGRTKDGHEFPVEVSLSPVETREGSWVSACVRDVTEHKRAERTLREKTSFAQSLLDTAQAIVLLLDSEGRIVQVNPYFEQLTGYAADEVLGEDWFTTFLPDEDQPAIHALFRDVMREGLNPGYTNAIVGKDGVQHQIEWRSKTLADGDGKTIGLLNIGHDVTARITAEAALQEAKREAERANAAKSRFLASASHDLRQPLQTISLLNEVLEKTLEDAGTLKILESQRQALTVIDGLLQAYLDVSRLEAGVVRPRSRNFPLAQFLARLRSEFELHCEKEGLELRVVSCGATIHSDPDLLAGILQNFVVNAVRHTHPPGRVLIGCRRRGSNLRLEVWDSGVGIPADQLETIFEEFYQLDNLARDRRAGLGLGLAIAHRTARLLGHTIDVRSTPGKGSMFAVEVPVGQRTPATVAVEKPGCAVARPASTASLLLIEDDPAVLEAMSLFLAVWDFQVTTALDGAQALTLLEGGAEVPDLIISDYRLPGGSTGLEVIQQIRTAVGRKLPAILMTGDTAGARLCEAEESGCRLVHKPAREGDLLPIIRELLQQGGRPGVTAKAAAPGVSGCAGDARSRRR